MNNSLIRLSSLCLLITVLAGCSGIQHRMVSTQKSKISNTIYLRGVFNFWEASEDYIAQQVPGVSNRWSTTIELIADGKPYDWKFGDENWQCGSSFGVMSGDSNIGLGQFRKADPCADFGSFQFTPPHDGYYQFILDWSRANPEVSISLIQ